MSKEMLINVAEGEECRIAVLADGVLQELYVERTSSGSQVGNIYKGRVTNVEPSIQAAFVDFGAAKNGFLHISDVQPQYFPKARQAGTESVGKKRARHDRPPIQDCLRRGQDVIVQVTKEGIGTKGPTLTTYLSIPGRFLVMMPGMSRLGVSRKIEDDELRDRLRVLLEELNPPDDMGFIVRTAALDRPKREVQADLSYLLRLWSSVEKRLNNAKAPAELYQESDLVIRTIRDIYSNEIERIICDNEAVAAKAREFLHVVMPRGKHTVQLYKGAAPLFHRFNLEREIEKIYARRVELPGGGSLVIDQTEALVAIDVNSGRYRAASNAEETAYKTNLTAAREVARQLRLRDMGGVIIIDFIDMREDKHQREIERVLRDGVKPDRARTKILKISRFGIIEMTRQRVRPSLKHSIYRHCAFCKGSGLIKSDESLALDVIRTLQLASANEHIANIELSVSPAVAEYLNNRRRRQLSSLEAQTGKVIHVRGNAALAGDDITFHCTDARGSVIAWDPASASEQAGPGAGAKARGDEWRKALEDDLSDVEAGALPEFEEEEITVEPLGEEVQQVQPAAEAAEAAAEMAEEVAPSEGEEEPAAPAVTAPPAAPGAEGPRKKRRHRAGRKHRRRKERAAAMATGGTEAPVAARPGEAAAPTPEREQPAYERSVEAVLRAEGETARPQRAAPPVPAAPVPAQPAAAAPAEAAAPVEAEAPAAPPAEAVVPAEQAAGPKKAKRTRRGGRRRTAAKKAKQPTEAEAPPPPPPVEPEAPAAPPAAKKPRRHRRRSSKTQKGAAGNTGLPEQSTGQ